MKITARLVLCLVTVLSILSWNTFGFANSIDIDYDKLTASELETIIQNASAAMEKNHSVSSAVKSTLESKTKASGERLISSQSGKLSWRWLDWSYTRDWDVINISTEVKIDGNWLPLEAKYYETDSDYELINMTVGGTTVYASDDDNLSEVNEYDENSIIAQKGDNNDTVREIQNMLIKLGYGKQKCDGLYGDSTEKIIKKFQRLQGLEQTGSVDLTTYNALKEAVYGSSEPSKKKDKTNQKKNESQKKEVKYSRIKSEKLYQAYTDNEIAADNSFKDKVIEVDGEITSIGKTWGTMHITLKGEPLGLVGIHCSMNNDQTDAVAKLKKGQSIVIRGKCTGYALEVMMDNCIIVG